MHQLEGRYANCFNSGFNAFEFVFEFGQYFPGAGDPHWHTRVITSPPYAKALFETIRESLTQYESCLWTNPTYRRIGLRVEAVVELL